MASLKGACASCGAKPAAVEVCSACGVTAYCNAVCQRAHWKSHRPECRVFGSILMDNLTEKAGAGDATAMFKLGLVYHDGLHRRPKSVDIAVHWFRKAAEAGHIHAQLMLGTSYATGEGVEKDMLQAIAWTRRAALAGDAAAQVLLGQSYAEGDGVDVDLEAAAAWYQKAADAGNQKAQFLLGSCCIHGKGVPVDMEKAQLLWRLAAGGLHLSVVEALATLRAKGLLDPEA